MSNENSRIDDAIEVCVPPISMADEKRNFSDGQDIDLVEFADFAKSESGTLGGIGVALDSLKAVSEDLDTFAQTGAAPGDLEVHAQALQEVVTILYHMADEEIDSYDTPVYTDSNPDSPEEEEQTSDSGNSSEDEGAIPNENLMKVTVDRISSSGNIIAEPVDTGPNHIHVQNGTIGETAITYHSEGRLSSQGGPNKPYTLPYESKEKAQAPHQDRDSVPLTEGQHIQVHNASKDEGFVYIDGFDMRAIKVDDEIKDGATVLLEITEVKTNTAVANLKDQSTHSTSSRNTKKYRSGSTTTTNRKSRTANRKSGGIPKVSGGLAGRKNDLLSGKKL